ncbi:MAG: nickel pincer cofactor biosynthesis protein LarB [Lentisphaeria bacterium]|nr:nickel pincer cofactor biosynthesis protein LarB [Lentisphaeria bacterium]
MIQDRDTDLRFAKLDMTRSGRTGMGETIYCPGKTPQQLAEIMQAFIAENKSVLGTKCTQEQYDFLLGSRISCNYDPVSRLLTCKTAEQKKLPGRIAVCTGGTADIPVAEEAAGTIEFAGAEVNRYYDVGVAGIHRLLSRIGEIREADAVIAVAGMEGALGSVLAGLVDTPVIAVPTSVGYGASFQGLAPLLSMLNSCAEGLSTVNIDNGFGAGVLAIRMLQMALRHEKQS